VVAVLLLARLFSQLYDDSTSSGKFDLYFLLTSGGGGGGAGLNYVGAKVRVQVLWVVPSLSPLPPLLPLPTLPHNEWPFAVQY
jgi:hypothetical protein